MKNLRQGIYLIMLFLPSAFHCSFDPTPAESIVLSSWTTIERDGVTFLKVTASNGVQAAVPDRNGQYGTSLAKAEQVLKTHHLFDHDKLYAALQQAEVPDSQLRAADVLSWDLHARTLGVPFHQLLGTRRQSVIRYGDARWRVGDTPQTYAEKVKNFGLPAVKLHIPGVPEPPDWGRGQQFTVDEVVDYLRVVRETNPDLILAYDLHPQVAAAGNIDDARTILAACDAYNYSWIEAPLPLEKSYWPDYATLRQEFKVTIQNEEEPLTYEQFLEWVESGAIDQICPAVYVHTDYGMTPVVHMLQWIKDHPEKGMTINLHYPSIEHVHLAFTMTDEQLPYFEAPWSGDYIDHLTKVNLYEKCIGPNGTAIAPSWPGIYDLEWLN